MTPTLDRRARRTRAMLRDAFVELILEKGYEAVTIQEITERADLARATFYLHYRSREDLLASSLEELYDELVARTRRYDRATFPPDPPFSLIAFEHAQENANLYRVLLNGEGVSVIVQRIRDHLAGHIQAQLRLMLAGKQTPIPQEVIAHYLTGALLGMIGWWLEHDMPHPAEQMARQYQQIGLWGVVVALGVELPPGMTKIMYE